MKSKVHLLVIDPQIDFCTPGMALYVAGAEQDSVRLANLIKRMKKQIYDIHVTLDSHHLIHIAHPIFWMGQDGKEPPPYTLIQEDDILSGKWTTRDNRKVTRDRALEYVRALKAGGRYLLCIWPPHCLIGSVGHSVQPEIFDALREWENENYAIVDYVTKGSNYFTEHYSAVRAEVEDPADSNTSLNKNLIDVLVTADVIAITGQALSHCVANTIRDIVKDFGEDQMRKFVLLEDTSSSVPSFEHLGEDFKKEMKSRGMQICNANDFTI